MSLSDFVESSELIPKNLTKNEKLYIIEPKHVTSPNKNGNTLKGYY